ncbi:DUF2848 family protein [Bradyrhizobium archetypum]|uniref:DUF2848 family protein n=1 Tax=Bradyrhizobium archetypum TaxID=2721160 RepID=UPI001F3FCB7F|nr:DUF2848 family protein [Bradyrhizobium archetypum]
MEIASQLVRAAISEGREQNLAPRRRLALACPSILGPDTSGEVESVIVAMADGLWVGIASDHTDRKAEASGIALSKQLCGMPIGPQLWSNSEVEGHWDELVLRSCATIDGKRVLYQESPVSSLRTPRDLIRRYTETDTLSAGTLMFCGTPGAIGGIRPETRFEIELKDPVLNRSLTHSYDVDVLPVVS